MAQGRPPEVHLSDLQRKVGQPEEHLRAHEEDPQRPKGLQVLRLQAPGYLTRIFYFKNKYVKIFLAKMVDPIIDYSIK